MTSTNITRNTKNQHFIYFSSTISVYVTNWYGHPYPLGLLPDHEIRISNVIKMISKKGHSYFTASLFTTFQLIDNCMVRILNNLL